MSETTVKDRPRPKKGRTELSIMYFLIGALALYFYMEFVTRYLNWSVESYGAYYWGKRIALAMHLFGATIALAAGLPQFWMGFRNRYMTLHKWAGRLYVVGVLIGSIGGFLMSTAQEQILGFGFAFALFALGTAWVITTGAAYFAIVNRRFKLHKEWMIRSYIVTLAFVTFRVLSVYVPYQSWSLDTAQYFTAMMWTCWVFPLMIAEVVLQFRKA